jgi:hypothetical protein
VVFLAVSGTAAVQVVLLRAAVVLAALAARPSRVATAMC